MCLHWDYAILNYNTLKSSKKAVKIFLTALSDS